MLPSMNTANYDQYPFIVIWEVTRACALKCLHCRAEAQYHPDPNQLTFAEGKQLIDQIAEMNHPLFVFTGGDPLMRPDLYELAQYAIEEKKLPVSMTPSATPKVTRHAVARAKEIGLSRWAFSLDGSNAQIHDHFRGTPGSYNRTMKGIQYLQEYHIPIQINTTVSRYNLHDLPQIAEQVRQMKAVLWSLFFLIPTGRGMQKDMITPDEHDEVMKWLYQMQQHMPFGVKATEAPHYRRVVIQQNVLAQAEATLSSQQQLPFKKSDTLGRAPKGVNDGDGFVFISHTGEVYPSGFLPLSCGNIKEQSLADIYQYSPIMQNLRNKSLLKGKCGVCEYKQRCGGSRARAFAVTGDYLESDPYCSYIPQN
ncbi:Coenzyme PQQ synthesis protein [Paenibacillus nuruki]|uniref:Coenzyme PQQ synthesis protein n=1 Tax=Paenibacillus nuruki TaxID=1886670 RepID=A0A1E3L2E2_9BACL|nr:TIGR04053 family radical SAM/SPASM domain-containing protein [Paenibacillus nuruki]ODP27906.1 Coenzyme PQQ synthesis protein [Paenibacillus nuruki]